MIDNALSVTSNVAKLFKHLKELGRIQQGVLCPPMFHISPTNLCNMNCGHCCFSNREKSLSIGYDDLCDALSSIFSISGGCVKAIELTGGGEPTLYEQINRLIREIKGHNDPAIGMNTNALSVKRVGSGEYGMLDWVRVSLNILSNPRWNEKFEENVRYLIDHTKKVTACYIVPQKNPSYDGLKRAVEFANKLNIPTRIAPDCIQSLDGIKQLIQRIGMTSVGIDNELVFLSDFNVYLEERQNGHCYMHAVKPFLYTDGWVYACPSSELAVENDRTMQPEYRVCHMTRIKQYYSKPLEVRHHACSYCKYAEQNAIIDLLFAETENNEFC